MNDNRPKLPRALLFDMDGTLTEPLLDFPAIRADIGVPAGHGLLEWMATLPEAERAVAEEKLHAHEDRAATASTLNSGCDELLAWVRERRLPTALITRNSRKSAACVLARHSLAFDVLITREDGEGKFKPDPSP